MARLPETKTVYQAEAKCLDVNARTAQDAPRVELRLFIGGDMVRKGKVTEKKTEERVLDLRHTGVTRLDMTVPVVGRKMGIATSILALQIEGNI
ncbi:MAG: hypothetical protein NT022_12925 [Deltaproteobacteria bacterium]|nr:hypothetical protein [Deltaproteobacteria bacterium]